MFRKCLAIAALIVAIPFTATAEMARYELDPDHTTVYFTVDHIGYAKTLGVFSELTGSFDYDAAARDLGQVSVAIDAASVNTLHSARDRHVRNSDFLDVGAHPQITFTAEGGTPTSNTKGRVTGDLTILGQSRPVTLDVTLNKSAPYPFGHKRDVLGLSMTATINRSDFGMTYGVANGLVGDEVVIRIETEAMKME